MRALLLYNPTATTTNAAVIDLITGALRDALDLERVPTKRRNHAGFLAAGAADEGYDIVIVLGGDGTVNEVVQGIATTDVALAIIPGGSTNVLARSLGMPNDPIAATTAILRRLDGGGARRVTLGLANDRYFTFHAGFGFDAEVVRQVERRYTLKRTVRQASFVWCALLRTTRTALTSSNIGRLRFVDVLSDLPEVICEADRPLPLQLDGDYVGESTTVTFRSVRDALLVVA